MNRKECRKRFIEAEQEIPLPLPLPLPKEEVQEENGIERYNPEVCKMISETAKRLKI